MARPARSADQPTVVCLSSLFATDRILLHSTFIERLAEEANPLVLSDAVNESTFPRDHKNSRYFQTIEMPTGFPGEYTRLRHFENFLWDHKKYSASRESSWRLKKRRDASLEERAIRALAKPFSYLPMEKWLERKLESTLIGFAPPKTTMAWLEKTRPAAVIAMYPFLEKQMASIAAVKRLGIPAIAFITSWDNITTKPRMIYHYDGYITWSEQMKKELLQFYPQSRDSHITVAGAPQYDVFFQTNYHLERRDFLGLYGLDPAKPVLLYCLGSPNMIREDFGALAFVERAMQHPVLSKTQIIIRLHPGHKEGKLTEIDKIRETYPQVVIQGTRKYWETFPFQGEEAIVEWINTVRHADVVINLASTMCVDAAIFNRPVVNINFDPQPGGPNHQMVREINSTWNHFSPISKSGGVWNVSSYDEMVTATETYLRSPELHSQERKWIVEHVCGKVDGQAGRRMAEGVIALLRQIGESRQQAAAF